PLASIGAKTDLRLRPEVDKTGPDLRLGIDDLGQAGKELRDDRDRQSGWLGRDRWSASDPLLHRRRGRRPEIRKRIDNWDGQPGTLLSLSAPDYPTTRTTRSRVARWSLMPTGIAAHYAASAAPTSKPNSRPRKAGVPASAISQETTLSRSWCVTGALTGTSNREACRTSARSRQQLPRSSVSVLSLVPGSCTSLVGPGRLPPAPGCSRLMSATRLVQGGPGALASPALERRHDPAKGVVVVQQVGFGAEAALRIPG